jgi:hypothetical protein
MYPTQPCQDEELDSEFSVEPESYIDLSCQEIVKQQEEKLRAKTSQRIGSLAETNRPHNIS